MATFLGFYMLIWPAISAVILVMICYGFIKEFREAMADGTDLV